MISFIAEKANLRPTYFSEYKQNSSTKLSLNFSRKHKVHCPVLSAIDPADRIPTVYEMVGMSQH